MPRHSAAVPPALLRLGQIALTFVLFSLCNRLGAYFAVENGVSILFPATAIAILATMSFGVWASIGIVLAVIVTPWTPQESMGSLVTSGVISSIEGLIPYVIFRVRRDLTADLRDMKSLVVFLIFGTVVNTLFSALAGNLLIVTGAFRWRAVFVWWIADFTAALLLATPALAFGGALLSRLRRVHPDRPRTITNTLQIVTVIILLGFAASFAIRTYLLNRLEQERLEQQESWSRAAETLNQMHSNFLRAAFIEASDSAGAMKLEIARRTNDEFVRQLTPLVTGASADLKREFPRIAEATTRWFIDAKAAQTGYQGATPGQGGAHQTGRSILALRAMMERANAKGWIDFAAKRKKIMIVASMVDALVFLILVFASATLLYGISRPFAQIRAAIRSLREGKQIDSRNIESVYLEFRTLAEALEEASRELGRREEELKLQSERALRASEHKSDFLAKMSHELRTPLNSIIGFTDLLTEQEGTISTPKRLNFLENVASSAKHLLHLINDLLDIAKVESGKLKMHFENVDLRQAVANTVASTQPLFVRKRQQVEVTLPDEPMVVRADVSRIEQVLLNLLSNANKFSPEGEKIFVRSGGDAQWWQVEISDRGAGIALGDQERIFNEFEQLHVRSAHSSGTGLGLALARRFVEAHGGEIGVESVVGAGSTFHIRLPRAMA
jgi:signal transduction histidine kinase